MENKIRLEKVFKEIFLEKLKSIEVTDVDQNNFEIWDSLNHLNLVIAIEQEFNVEIEPEEMAELNSFIKIMSFLENRLSNTIKNS